jgi:hypothetical protein
MRDPCFSGFALFYANIACIPSDSQRVAFKPVANNSKTLKQRDSIQNKLMPSCKAVILKKFASAAARLSKISQNREQQTGE